MSLWPIGPPLVRTANVLAAAHGAQPLQLADGCGSSLTSPTLAGTTSSNPLQRPRELSVSASSSQRQSQGHSGRSITVAGEGSSWWPVELGTPSALGAQNDLRYAYFAAARRLAINHGGRITIHDTGDHRVSGVSQQFEQGSRPSARLFPWPSGSLACRVPPISWSGLSPPGGAGNHQ